MPTSLQFLILILAVFRVTRLVIEDTILEPLREKTVYKLDPQTSMLRELLECPWCLGFWFSIVAIILYAIFPEVILWGALPFAVSAGVGLIASNSR